MERESKFPKPTLNDIKAALLLLQELVAVGQRAKTNSFEEAQQQVGELAFCICMLRAEGEGVLKRYFESVISVSREDVGDDPGKAYRLEHMETAMRGVLEILST